MENSRACFLKMSGAVPAGKHKEFEQTFKFVSNHMPPDCLQLSLSADIFNADLYHFFSLWPTPESLAAFCRSQEFHVLEGAYETLGSTLKNSTGKQIDIRSFDIADTGILPDQYKK